MGALEPFFGNPNLQRQGEKARQNASGRDVNTLLDPKTYAAVMSFLGTAPDQLGFSAMHPDIEGIKSVADPAYALGLATQVAQSLPKGTASALAKFGGEKANGALTQYMDKTGMRQNIFIGESAKTWNKPAAQQAEKMLAEGVDPKTVWKETGTFRGVDGKLRQEIPDNQSQALPLGNWSWGSRETVKQGDSTTGHVGEFLRHQPLERAYPNGVMDFGNADKRLTMNVKPGRSGGSFDGRTIEVGMDGDGINKSTTLHELQHAIQEREGWARGGSPDEFTHQNKAELARDALSWRSEILRQRKNMPDADLHHVDNVVAENYRNMGASDWIPPIEARNLALQPSVLFPEHYPQNQFSELENLVKTYGLKTRTTPYTQEEAYRRLAGEAEARATQARMNMDAAQRREVFPLDSYDVPIDQLIKKYDGAGTSYATKGSGFDQIPKMLDSMKTGYETTGVIPKLKKVPAVVLSDKESAAFNAARPPQAPQLLSNVLGYRGNHHFESRGPTDKGNGYPNSEILAQLDNVSNQDLRLVRERNGDILQGTIPRINAAGQKIQDALVLNVDQNGIGELFSVKPYGDGLRKGEKAHAGPFLIGGPAQPEVVIPNGTDAAPLNESVPQSKKSVKDPLAALLFPTMTLGALSQLFADQPD